MKNFVLSCCSTLDLSPEHVAARDISYVCFHYYLNDVPYADDLGQSMPFDEFYQILTLRVLNRHEKPSVLYTIDGFWNSTLAVIREGVEKGFISAEALEDFVLCDTPKAIFDFLEK